MLARRLDECQRTEAVLILFQLATSATEEMIDSAIDGGAKGGVGASNELELLQEIQRLDLKVRDAEEYALEKSVRCQDAEALRQEAENAVDDDDLLLFLQKQNLACRYIPVWAR